MLRSYNLGNNLAGVYQAIACDFPGHELSFRSYIALYVEYLSLLRDSKKRTTVRYVKSGIDVPTSCNLEVVRSNPIDSNDRAKVGWVRVDSMCIKRWRDFDTNDAQADGFGSLADLKSALRQIYGDITDNEYLTIYHIADFNIPEEVTNGR